MANGEGASRSFTTMVVSAVLLSSRARFLRKLSTCLRFAAVSGRLSWRKFTDSSSASSSESASSSSS